MKTLPFEAIMFLISTLPMKIKLKDKTINVKSGDIFELNEAYFNSPIIQGLLSGEKLKRFNEMSLSEFEKANLIVRIHSKLLGEDIYFLSHETLREKIKEDLVSYSAKELKELIKLPSSQWEKIYLLKRELKGVILDE